MDEQVPTRFEVVAGRDLEKGDEPQALSYGIAVQRQLFPIPRKGMMVFVSMSRISDSDFENALELARPTDVLDCRKYPRFDFGRMNRRSAFEMFDEMSAVYVDVYALCEAQEVSRSEQAFGLLERKLVRADGAVVVLVDDAQSEDKHLVDEALNALVDKQNLEILEVPPTSRPELLEG